MFIQGQTASPKEQAGCLREEHRRHGAVQLGDWSERPFMVVWEVTRACALACRHCRAEAQARPGPEELGRWNSLRVIDQIAELDPKLFILTGGDPACRTDLVDLVAYAAQKGLRVAVSPSATPRWLRHNLSELKQAGLAAISLSLDGAEASTHDAFRGVPGTWQNTLHAYELARDAGLAVQINSTFTRQNRSEFSRFTELISALQPTMWSIFLLVPTGRAQMSDQVESLFTELADFSRNAPCGVKTTEGHHYRRILLEQSGLAPGTLRLQGVGDGKGFVFISHRGEVFPSGFLPISCGLVPQDHLREIYRNSPIFRALRDDRQLEGKCGRCRFRRVCGGSRARAFAMTGNYLAEEPLCPYQPTPEDTQAALTQLNA
jgi:radical SAM protein with 4Fe4S-binding SPASM domain